ncbi:MAG: multifunctional CCA tRNA nucleotidyl transferase/2'3'-cyclic phosphodiesterase/2'nucleotidase/phosphatase [Legionellaceae bacterium]|nr:multifunctional CCA tRNA nucleotidyl transferase/2'3'-cyclic phosphodiesterase/2'nucleotidase/phosphatase [Legionellaceae bacterium]
MKVYLVGGAVRDALLKLPVHERDWVIVGSTPEALLELGYQQVGRDFPVFLHPETKEEYALARTERKVGVGYRGFVCDASPSVTLKEDLARRDLTINAMAEDEAGLLIDPYNGAGDITDKVLRHVSPAFVEDPVRVLRLARFAARFYHLGFRVADETRVLVSRMVEQGELQHLVPERVWQEWHKSLETQNPEVFMQVLHNLGALGEIFPSFKKEALTRMQGALLSVSQRSESPLVRFAAFLYLLGDAEQIDAVCRALKVPNAYRALAVLAASVCETLSSKAKPDAETMVCVLEKVDAFRKPERFLDLLCVCEARTIEQNIWQLALKACEGIDMRALVAEGHQGAAMKKALHARRVVAVQAHLN